MRRTSQEPYEHDRYLILHVNLCLCKEATLGTI